MLGPFLPDLLDRRIVLGSSSCRRLEIMRNQLGLTNVEVVASTFPETLNKAMFSPVDYCQSTCLGKTYELLGRAPSLLHEDRDLLICADTIVEFDGEILEKPATPEQAAQFLRRLSGNVHTVHTHVSISSISEQRNFATSCLVTFASLDEETIAAYVATGEPYDKAGGYGYQSLAASFVRKIEGDYYCVVGLPVNELSQQLIAFIRK